MRIISNPKPIQTDYYVEGEQLVDFKIDFLNKIPVIWTVFALIVDRRRASTTSRSRRRSRSSRCMPPEEEDLSGIAPVEA